MRDAIVYIGRFQPLHNGHLAVLGAALAQARKVVLVVGSAGSAKTPRNPFSYAERAEMIRQTVQHAWPDRVQDVLLTGVRDYYDDARWVNAVQHQVAACLAAVGQAGAQVALIGHFKDATSDYLDDFPAWPLVQHENVSGINATDIRNQIYFGAPAAAAEGAAAVPPAVHTLLAAWRHTDTWRDLAAWAVAGQQYRDAWARAPYPPIFATADAVVQSKGQLLLVQRAQHPGKGLWALPGGFVNQNERVLDAAIRELNEETRLALPPRSLKAAHTRSAVFDHPARSERGRTITHAAFFDLDTLGLAAPPSVTAADDAAQACWFPLREVRHMEAQLYEDHAMIIDTFVPLFDPPLG